MRILVMALLATALTAGPAWAARWAKVENGIVTAIYTGNRGVKIGSTIHGPGLFRGGKWTAERLLAIGIQKVVVGARPAFNPLTHRLQANRLEVNDMFGNETWTIAPLGLQARRRAVRAKRRSEYRKKIGLDIRVIIKILNQMQKMKEDGIAMTAEMDEVLTSFAAISAAYETP